VALNIRKFFREVASAKRMLAKKQRINSFIKKGMVPWSLGYIEYRDAQIERALNGGPVDVSNWGRGLDERIVEIPWTLENLSSQNSRLLDAGSTLNHDFILDHPKIKNKDLTICTYFPEAYARYQQRISYVYQDLRQLNFKDEWFDEVVCVSTLEHIDMDNRIYGYDSGAGSTGKSYEYLTVLEELLRVLARQGKLLLTFPFGKYENHGFFQQLDEEMLGRLLDVLRTRGHFNTSFFKYEKAGWRVSAMEMCKESESFNPHTGHGKKEDGAAHSRSICCVSFTKSGG
jgi:hypothetical protein